MPISPTVNDTVRFVDIGKAMTINPVTIDKNGSNIMQLDENMTINTNNISFSLVYIDASNGWVIV